MYHTTASLKVTLGELSTTSSDVQLELVKGLYANNY
jgi:hypothetical protein